VVRLRTTVPPNQSFENPPYLEVETYLHRPRPSTTIHDCVVTVGRDAFLVSAYWDKSRDAPINRSIFNATGVHWRGEATVAGIGRVVPYLKRVRNAWDAEAALLKWVSDSTVFHPFYALSTLIFLLLSSERFLQAFKIRRTDKKRPPRFIC
jgi:hypothetical protein